MSLATLVENERLSIGIDQRVIKAAEVRQLVDAAAIIQRCQDIVTECREEACRDAELARARGLEEGRREGMQQTAALVDATERALAGYLDAVDAAVAGLALRIVRRIAPRLDPEQLIPAWIEEALQRIRSERYLKLRFHPDNRDVVQRCLAEARGAVPRTEFFELVEDPAQDRFGVVLESDCGVVETGLHAQLDALSASLAAAKPAGEDA